MCTVDTMGVQREANLMMMADDEVKVGDYVLLHIGFVMNKIDEEEALKSIETYKEILEIMEEEREAGDNCLSPVASHDDCDVRKERAPQDGKEERRRTILEDDNCPARGLE
jgi:hydrogenase expression/formation protein HypC